jgi:hypothetical protein
MVRFLLYHQFNIPFDNTRTNAQSDHESVDDSELAGLASTLLERHCQILRLHPKYKIVVSDADTTASESFSEEPFTEVQSQIVEVESTEYRSISDSIQIDSESFGKSTDETDEASFFIKGN